MKKIHIFYAVIFQSMLVSCGFAGNENPPTQSSSNASAPPIAAAQTPPGPVSPELPKSILKIYEGKVNLAYQEARLRFAELQYKPGEAKELLKQELLDVANGGKKQEGKTPSTAPLELQKTVLDIYAAKLHLGYKEGFEEFLQLGCPPNEAKKLLGERLLGMLNKGKKGGEKPSKL